MWYYTHRRRYAQSCADDWHREPINHEPPPLNYYNANGVSEHSSRSDFNHSRNSEWKPCIERKPQMQYRLNTYLHKIHATSRDIAVKQMNRPRPWNVTNSDGRTMLHATRQNIFLIMLSVKYTFVINRSCSASTDNTQRTQTRCSAPRPQKFKQQN